jgi:malonyl-CoA O-methyltransferase
MIDLPPDRRARIAAAFGRAARYDEAAAAQRAAADALGRRIAAQPLPAQPRILELGCGTGFLTRALAGAIGPARWTVSDIAPAMVARARAGLDLEADWRVIDGEAVDPALGPFDLIASSLAFQWFADLPSAVARLGGLLEPGGLLAFSTMAAGSFAEWAETLAAEGLAAGTPAYPDAAALAALAGQGYEARVEVVDLPQQPPDARAFLRGLKDIGAGTPAPGYRPLAAAALRRAMARFDAGPRIVTYRVGFCLFRKN